MYGMTLDEATPTAYAYPLIGTKYVHSSEIYTLYVWHDLR
jgi:hypothetical protein